MKSCVGLLALQGAVTEHTQAFAKLGVDVSEVRTPHDLNGLDAIVLPGGESTTISMLLDSSGLFQPLKELLDDGFPALGTCAGMILLAEEISDGRADQKSFQIVDITVRRNAFGRQAESFESNVEVVGVVGAPFPAVFIRAPRVERTGDGVEVMASVDGCPVLCRQGRVMVSAFHPELSGDLRIHQMFLEGV